jgi:uncharacterized membrane protein
MEIKLKKISVWLLGMFFIVAGINHFLMPDFYLPLIPPYIPFPQVVNSVAGLVEIILGVTVLLPNYRAITSKGIILLLILFIPSHVHFILIGSCVENGLCVHPAIAWLRLVVIHPLLIFWAWKSK